MCFNQDKELSLMFKEGIISEFVTMYHGTYIRKNDWDGLCMEEESRKEAEYRCATKVSLCFS